MKKRYFLKTFSGVLLAFILFASGNLLAQNRSYLDFDGTDDYVKYFDDATLGLMDGATDYTIEAWIYPKTGVQEYDRVLQRYNSFAIIMYDGNNDGNVEDWYFEIFGSTNYYFNTEGDATLTLDTWNHIAVINNSTDGTLKLYVNGLDVTTSGGYSNRNMPSSSTSDNLFIGQKGNNTDYFKGYIDEVRLKNVAEDPTHLHFHAYDNEYQTDISTAALFHFDEGSGNAINTASGTSARNGSTTGSDSNDPVWRAWSYSNHLPLAHEWTGTTTDWATTGNWDGDVPAAANDVIIPTGLSNYPVIAIATDANCNNIYVESGATVTLESTSSGDASLIVAGTVSGSGSFDVKRHIGLTNSDALHGWHFISSPVTNQAISTEFVDIGASPISGDVDFYRWSEKENLWINIKNSSGSYNQGTAGTNFSNDASPAFEVDSGYLIAYSSDQTKTFSGTLNNSSASVSGLSKDNDGWHLLGNPFPCALYWNKTTADWNLSNVNSTAKIWDESSASYTDITAGGTYEIIPAMQGFLVQANAAGASLTIPLSDRTHSSTAWYKDAGTNNIILTVYDTEGHTAQASIVRIAEGSTAGFDTQYDSHFLAGYAPRFYSVVGQEKLSTNTIPDVSAMQTIPFDFIKNASDTYYIEAEGIDNLVPEQDVYLTDLKTNYTQKLNDNPVYHFTAQEGDVAQRFELHFSALGVNQINTLKSFNIYSCNNQIVVRANKPADAVINVYNITGQLITKAQMTGQTVKTMALNGFTGIAIVSVVSSKGTQNQKVIIR